MRPYEVMVILDPTLEESAVQAVINRSTELVSSRGGDVGRVDKWGKRRLAYEIGHKAEGYYVLFEATSEPAPMADLDRSLHLADDVIRHKIVRIPDNAGGRTLPPGAIDQLSMSGSKRDRDRDRD
jgi:small subunit ribosomal protein S6